MSQPEIYIKVTPGWNAAMERFFHENTPVVSAMDKNSRCFPVGSKSYPEDKVKVLCLDFNSEYSPREYPLTTCFGGPDVTFEIEDLPLWALKRVFGTNQPPKNITLSKEIEYRNGTTEDIYMSVVFKNAPLVGGRATGRNKMPSETQKQHYKLLFE